MNGYVQIKERLKKKLMHFVKPGKLTGCFQNGKEKTGFIGCEG